MLSRFPFRLATRFWAALLVLTIALSALAPIEAPLGLRSGSAFSADTVEVAVAPVRRVEAVERLVALPQPPLLPVLAVVLAALPLALLPVGHRWPAPTGPPARRSALSRKAAPRGPPHT